MCFLSIIENIFRVGFGGRGSCFLVGRGLVFVVIFCRDFVAVGVFCKFQFSFSLERYLGGSICLEIQKRRVESISGGGGREVRLEGRNGGERRRVLFLGQGSRWVRVLGRFFGQRAAVVEVFDFSFFGLGSRQEGVLVGDGRKLFKVI